MAGSRMRYKLDEALGNPKDWFLTWSLADDVTLSSTCGFCGQAGQRLTYQVRRGNEERWVCQRCTGRYAFGGILEGRILDAVAVRRHLLGLASRLKQRTCQDVIRKAHAGADDLALVEAILYFDRNLQLSPKHAAPLFAAMNRLEEPLDIRIFDVQTRGNAHQQEFGALEEADKITVWPALSARQKRRLTALGYAPVAKGRSRRPAARRQAGLAEDRLATAF